MQAPVLTKNAVKTALTKLKAEFDRLRRKINDLHEQFKFQKQQCEEALLLYHSHFDPTRIKAGELITQYIFKIIDITKDPKSLNEKQKKSLNELLKKDLDRVFNLLPYNKIDPEIKKIYKTIYGKESDADFHEGLTELKEFFKEQTGKDDIDLSDLDPNDSLEEAMIKIMNSLKDKNLGFENDEIPAKKEKPKSKKESIKEQKALELKLMQEKNLSNIYKRLAKEVHPDLEQNEEIRAEKADLMKKITVAYENKDLLSLISLESKWLNGVDTFEIIDELSLKAYNSLLKEQIQDLKNEIVMCALNPRYFDIHPYIQEDPKDPVCEIQDCINEVKGIMEPYNHRLKDLSGNKVMQILKEVLDDFSNFQNLFPIFSALDFLAEEDDDTDDFF